MYTEDKCFISSNASGFKKMCDSDMPIPRYIGSKKKDIPHKGPKIAALISEDSNRQKELLISTFKCKGL